MIGLVIAGGTFGMAAAVVGLIAGLSVWAAIGLYFAVGIAPPAFGFAVLAVRENLFGSKDDADAASHARKKHPSAKIANRKNGTEAA